MMVYIIILFFYDCLKRYDFIDLQCSILDFNKDIFCYFLNVLDFNYEKEKKLYNIELYWRMFCN